MSFQRLWHFRKWDGILIAKLVSNEAIHKVEPKSSQCAELIMSAFAQWLSQFGFRVWLHVVSWRIDHVKYSEQVKRWDEEGRKVSGLLTKKLVTTMANCGLSYWKLSERLYRMFSELSLCDTVHICQLPSFSGWQFPRPTVQAPGWLRSENGQVILATSWFNASSVPKSLWWAMTWDIWTGWGI